MNQTYSIQQVANKNGVSVHVLRYYEKIGLICDIKRDIAGRRQYTDTDLEWIDFIVCMRTSKLSLEQMRVLAELRRRGAQALSERIVFMEDYRKAIEEKIVTFHDILKQTDRKIALLKRELTENQITT